MRISRFAVIAFIVFAQLAVAACNRDEKAPGASTPGAPNVSAEASPDLKAVLTSKTAPSYVGTEDLDRHLWKIERQFYARNGYRLAWVAKNRPTREANDIIEAVKHA